MNQLFKATRLKRSTHFALIFSAFLMLTSMTFHGQMITGFWKGRINRQKVEVKIIQHGDSLTGTSYYYESATNYRRYNIKGYFNSKTNEAVWWDDQLLEEKTGKLNLSTPGKNAMLSSADFNCPGGGKMMLDGKSGKKDENSPTESGVHLDKMDDPVFLDEWDFVIDNFQFGTNDPRIIDSIDAIAMHPPGPTITIQPAAPVIVTKPAPVKRDPPVVIAKPTQKIEKNLPKATTVVIPVIKEQTIEEKFVTRKKVLTKEIPLTGDSIILSFYDNAEIDGDSISLFLNDRLIFSHIRLTGSAYQIKLAVADLAETNELIMVAENLGTIPPNTSYMIAMVGEQRYDARLESTEGSSALVRFVKKKP